MEQLLITMGYIGSIDESIINEAFSDTGGIPRNVNNWIKTGHSQAPTLVSLDQYQKDILGGLLEIQTARHSSPFLLEGLSMDELIRCLDKHFPFLSEDQKFQKINDNAYQGIIREVSSKFTFGFPCHYYELNKLQCAFKF